MPWLHNGNIVRAGKPWTSNIGIKHPYNWMGWPDEQKAKAGLVWKNDPAPYDNRFYWDAETPKDLDGLKATWKQNTKGVANQLLSFTDWKVIKASEVESYTVDSTTLDYRAAVRTASNNIEAAIDGAKDHAAFMALFVTPLDADGKPTANAPIHDWPDEI